MQRIAVQGNFSIGKLRRSFDAIDRNATQVEQREGDYKVTVSRGDARANKLLVLPREEERERSNKGNGNGNAFRR